MGITERREREREEVRRKILDAARELFAGEGYERVTMRRIAEAIEYSPTAIYHHFEDKDDVVRSLCEEDFGGLLAALQAEAPPADPLQRIRQLGLAYARFGLTYPNHYRFMFMTPATKHEHECEHAWTEDGPGLRSFGMLRAAVAEAVERGLFRPGNPDAYAQVHWASVHGAVALAVTLRPDQFPGAPMAADLVEQVIENGIRGLLAQPAGAAAARRGLRRRPGRRGRGAR